MTTVGNPNNYMTVFLQAAISSQTGILNQQLADTKTTEGLANLESNLNQVWNSPDVLYHHMRPYEGILTFYADVIQNLVAQYEKDPNNQTLQQQIQAAQSAYQVQSAAANASTSNADSLVQTSQSQSQQDSSNLQNLLQVVQAAMALMSSIASLLSK